MDRMLPSRPPILHGSSERTAARSSSPLAAETRTRCGSQRKLGGRGTPKLTSSWPRSAAFPSKLTTSCAGAAAMRFPPKSRLAVKLKMPDLINDRRERFDLSIESLITRALAATGLCTSQNPTDGRDCVKTQRNLQSRLDNSSCVNSQVGKGAVV